SISSCSVASLALLLHLHSFPTRRSSDLERSEIAASINGVPIYNVGSRTDVMDACPKAEGMMMMIRSMSPEVLVVDEIGSEEDVQALLEAINAGVTIFCTIHGRSLQELKNRPTLQAIFQQKVRSE